MGKLDLSKYREWGVEEILLWIMSLENGLFVTYKSNLSKNLSMNEIEGNDLKDINEHNAWREFGGMNKFAHRKLLIEHVKSLIHSQSDVDAHVIEGDSTPYINR